MISCDTVGSHSFIVYAESAVASHGEIVQHGSLQRLPVGATNAYQTTLVPGLYNPVGLEFYHTDHLNGYVFWSDPGVDSYIARVSFDGSHSEIIAHGVRTDSLAVDWISGNLYWVDFQVQGSELVNFTISVSRLDGRFRKKLITSGLNSPKGIAVLPKQGYVATSNME